MEKILDLTYLKGMLSSPQDRSVLLTSAMKQAMACPHTIKEFLQADDAGAIHFYCHSYKSSVKVIGAERLKAQLSVMEQAAKAKDHLKMEEAYAIIENLCCRVVEEIQQELLRSEKRSSLSTW